MADIRWISIEPALKRILKQWDSLKTHFDIVRVQENCYTAELLHNMYADSKNRVYLTFLNVYNCGAGTKKPINLLNLIILIQPNY